MDFSGTKQVVSNFGAVRDSAIIALRKDGRSDWFINFIDSTPEKKSSMIKGLKGLINLEEIKFIAEFDSNLFIRKDAKLWLLDFYSKEATSFSGILKPQLHKETLKGLVKELKAQREELEKDWANPEVSAKTIDLINKADGIVDYAGRRANALN